MGRFAPHLFRSATTERYSKELQGPREGGKHGPEGGREKKRCEREWSPSKKKGCNSHIRSSKKEIPVGWPGAGDGGGLLWQNKKEKGSRFIDEDR